MKLTHLVLTVLLAAIFVPLTATNTIHAQENCNPEILVSEMNGDLANYGGRATNAAELDMEGLSTLYFDLMDLRHRYEDRSLCDELGELNNLMLQIIAEMEDITVLHMAWLSNPDAEHRLRAHPGSRNSGAQCRYL